MNRDKILGRIGLGVAFIALAFGDILAQASGLYQIDTLTEVFSGILIVYGVLTAGELLFRPAEVDADA